MTPQGRAYAIQRLMDCPDLDALRRVWDNLGIEYKRDPAVPRAKDELKERMK